MSLNVPLIFVVGILVSCQKEKNSGSNVDFSSNDTSVSTEGTEEPSSVPQPEQEESVPQDSGSPDYGGAEPEPSDSGGSASTESIEEGNWTLSNVQPSSASDSCSSSLTLFSDAMGIGNSEEFNIVYEHPNQFLWTKNQDTYTCTVQNSSFSCSSVSQTTDISSSSFPMILEETRTYAGDILDSTTMDVELSSPLKVAKI